MLVESITVLIVDDDPVVREGLAAILESQEAIEVVGEAADGEQAVELATRLRPRVVLIDIAMPRLDGIEATRRIIRLRPEARVIFLTEYGHQLMDALAAGGCHYLLKDCPIDQLVGVIRGCARC